MHPVLAELGPFTVHTYGVFTALAAFAAFALSSRRAAAHGLSPSHALDILFALIVGGIVGARLFYVLQNPAEFAGDWTAVARLDQGGLVWYGGFLLAVACGTLLARKRRQPILPWADFFSPILALSHAIGRLGCFFNGCCSGRDGIPAQLIEAAGLAALSAVLFLYARRRPATGKVFAVYLLGYGALRFLLEYVRADQPSWAGLTPPQWISIGLAGASLLLFRRSPKG